MKKFISIFSAAVALVMSVASCVQDLTIKPEELDPSIKLPEQVLNTPEAFNQLLAKCYQGLACSGSDGQDGGPDISGVDGGYGQYIRAMFHLQCLSTDEAVCCWNDQTLYDIHNLCWSTSDTFVAAAYYRVFFQVGLCNEFIRQAGRSHLAIPPQWIAEARALRLLSYYHAIDLFGNVPFFTEQNSVGAEGPDLKKRGDLWDWMVNEAKELTSSQSALSLPGQAEYGRIDQGAVKMILAKLYLNAQIWKDPAANYFQECGDLCMEIIETYGDHLDTPYSDLFSADNHRCVASTTYGSQGEIIFAVPQDGLNIRSYGVTNYIIFASTGGDMDAAGQMGISSGWGGLSLTKAFTDKFEAGDARAMFYTGHGQEISDISDFKAGGYKSMKFRNINHDGSAAQEAGFVDTDFPVFRLADAYLMAAECQARGAANITGSVYLNKVRHRAGLGDTSLTLDNILDERAREFYHELSRRQDLIRFGAFTTDKYLWDYKGGVKEGKAVDAKYNLYPLCSSDVNANGKLVQNPGY